MAHDAPRHATSDPTTHSDTLRGPQPGDVKGTGHDGGLIGLDIEGAQHNRLFIVLDSSLYLNGFGDPRYNPRLDFDACFVSDTCLTENLLCRTPGPPGANLYCLRALVANVAAYR